ncbi:MAG: hypothetical protein P9M08_13250 [Candidatus Erginobacter occultus]|nr:hypothetical protein [Candidatus Erginobacter occultus]
MPAFRTAKIISAAAALAVAAGCSSVISTSDFSGTALSSCGARPVAHVHSDIWGIYFLGFESCPVITGSASHPGSFHLFRNYATTNAAAEMVLEESRDLGADAVLDLKTDWDSSWQTYTLIFWLKEAQASGNAVLLSEEDGDQATETSGGPGSGQ